MYVNSCYYSKLCSKLGAAPRARRDDAREIGIDIASCLVEDGRCKYNTEGSISRPYSHRPL